MVDHATGQQGGDGATSNGLQNSHRAGQPSDGTVEQRLRKLAWLTPKSGPELATALGIGTAGYTEFMLVVDRLVCSKQLACSRLCAHGVEVPAYQWADRPTLLPPV